MPDDPFTEFMVGWRDLLLAIAAAAGVVKLADWLNRRLG